jgi:hypothetical protein
MNYPTTADGRYFVVQGRLWRKSSPCLSELRRSELVGELMAARRAVGVALRHGNPEAVAVAREASIAPSAPLASADPSGDPTAHLISTGRWS